MNSRLFIVTALAALSAIVAHAAVMPDPTCENVCYVMDQSGSIDATTEYPALQGFVVSISNKVEDVANSDPFNSAVGFASQTKVIQNPTQDLLLFQSKVNQPKFPDIGSGTVISEGLKACRSLLSEATGDRVIALITDGVGDTVPSNQEAALIKNAGITLVTVGIGDGVSEDFLRNLASDPALYIDAEDFANLDSEIDRVVRALCFPDDIIDPTKCDEAFETCEFTFRGTEGLTTFPFTGEPDVPFTTGVVPKDTSFALGNLNTNNIVPEFIDDDGNARPITEFGSQRFTPTHFKPFWIDQERGSGIGHQTFQGNQATVARGKCVRVYFTSFQEIRPNGLKNRNNVKREENKCVVFRTEPL